MFTEELITDYMQAFKNYKMQSIKPNTTPADAMEQVVKICEKKARQWQKIQHNECR